MGLIGRVIGATGAARQVGAAVTGVAEVFVGNRAEREAAEFAQRGAAIGQYAAEFATQRASRFDAFMNGLNRLPRPLLVMGTLGLFGYAMAAPAGFSLRMQGLALVPEPLWWLLGAIVSFYFGARELHYRREGVVLPAPAPVAPPSTLPEVAAERDPAPEHAPSDAAPEAVEPPRALFRRPPAATSPAPAVRAADSHYNAALEEWRRLRG